MNYSNNHTSNLRNNTMIINGQGQVTAIPDIAVLRIGVQTMDENLTTAQQENARLSQSFLDAIQQLGITDIKTFQYTANRQFDFENGTRIDRGYLVRNIFEIRTSDMDTVGSIIDTAVSAGANVVDFVNFEVSNINLYYQQALNLAVQNAYQKASSIASSLGTAVNPIPAKITENSAAPIPFSVMFSTRESMVPTPVEPGTKEIIASVTVEFVF
ncbi:MAG: DUF541 domain-containing protein [Lachnospiraceae bacterium]|nr:DUF541 domain-containing protein [Lachnospiraceae bacterium]